MNKQVVYEPRPQYVVQLGTVSFEMYSLGGIEWEFHAAYWDEDSAHVRAIELAKSHEHVRVIDRGETDGNN